MLGRPLQSLEDDMAGNAVIVASLGFHRASTYGTARGPPLEATAIDTKKEFRRPLELTHI